MRGIRKTTAGACICVLAVLCAACIDTVGDDVIPTHFEPVAWKDSMIFLATNEGPCQVQLWDTETRRLVKRYMFSMEDRVMSIGDMTADKGRFWISLDGKSETLVQVDAASGKVSKIDLDIQPCYLQYVEGVLWVFEPYSSREGFRIRRLNRDGVLVQSLTIKKPDVELALSKSIVYVGGSFLVPIRTNPDAKNAGNCIYIANLSKGGELTEVPPEALYPGPLLGNLGNVIYDYWNTPDPNRSAMYWYKDAPGYATVTFSPASLSWYWYYKVESYLPLKLSGPIITHHRQGDRTSLYISETEKYLFTGGRLINQLEDDPTYAGMEIGIYPKEGGEVLGFFRLWNSNQIAYAKRDGETWFAKNIWSWDYGRDKWNFAGETEAYILDEANVKLYRVKADGTTVLVQEYLK
jgi:hypothetical protein